MNELTREQDRVLGIVAGTPAKRAYVPTDSTTRHICQRLAEAGKLEVVPTRNGIGYKVVRRA